MFFEKIQKVLMINSFFDKREERERKKKEREKKEKKKKGKRKKPAKKLDPQPKE